MDPHLVTDYLSTALSLESRASAVRKTVAALSPHVGKFDCIAFRGMSGALVAPSVADQLGKELILVRKGEDRHGSAQVEGVKSRTRYVIVDDFISRGTTARAIYTAIERAHFAANCIPLLICMYARSAPPGDTQHLADDVYVSVIGVEDHIDKGADPESNTFGCAYKIYSLGERIVCRTLGILNPDGGR